MAASLPALGKIFLAPALAALLIVPGQAQEQNRLAQLEAEFTRESKPIKKAKKLVQLGQAELQAIREAVGAGQSELAVRLAERYRDQARSALAALLRTGVNAENHPDGFKQLQISLRENILKLREITLTLPVEQRGRLDAVRPDLEAINQQLLHKLFPRASSQREKKGR